MAVTYKCKLVRSKRKSGRKARKHGRKAHKKVGRKARSIIKGLRRKGSSFSRGAVIQAIPCIKKAKTRKALAKCL